MVYRKEFQWRGNGDVPFHVRVHIGQGRCLGGTTRRPGRFMRHSFIVPSFRRTGASILLKKHSFGCEILDNVLSSFICCLANFLAEAVQDLAATDARRHSPIIPSLFIARGYETSLRFGFNILYLRRSFDFIWSFVKILPISTFAVANDTVS